MIHLDTNVLVDLATAGSLAGLSAKSWLEAGETLGTSAIAWSEFCNGPLSSAQKDAVFAVLGQQISDFTWREAENAARLFNLGGRRPGSHAHCMLAAAAMAAGATLATFNVADFSRFVPMGLSLEPIEPAPGK